MSSVVAAVIRRHTRMHSGNVGRSQGIRRMLSAFTKKNIIILLVIVCQIKHCENMSTCNETFIFIARSALVLIIIRCGDMGIE